MMKFIYMFFVLCLTTICIAKSTNYSPSEKQEMKCNEKLKVIARNNLNLNNINEKNISFNNISDNENEEILQVFVSSDGENGGAVLGSIKINKIEKKIYDITDDEYNNESMKLSENNSFFRECVH